MYPLKKYRKNQWRPNNYLGVTLYWWRPVRGGIEVKELSV